MVSTNQIIRNINKIFAIKINDALFKTRRRINLQIHTLYVYYNTYDFIAKQKVIYDRPVFKGKNNDNNLFYYNCFILFRYFFDLLIFFYFSIELVIINV